MLVHPGHDAYAQIVKNISRKSARYPRKGDSALCIDGGIFPVLSPKFRIAPGRKVFTIGSCFARHIEPLLIDYGLNIPVARFALPAGEFRHPAPHILNEYNAGTIIQRLESAVGAFSYDGKGIEVNGKGAVDLFLHVETQPVAMERLIERRRQIGELYRELLSSDVVVITLGLVESWYDTKHQCYLNKAPSKALVNAERGRFEFHRMDIDDVLTRIDKAVRLLLGAGTKNILLTVSPVPIEATFMPDNVVVANSYSKSVLRVCAELLSKRYEQVDYFPSYEIVQSFGTSAFEEDNVHVRPEVIARVTRYMVEHFAGISEQGRSLVNRFDTLKKEFQHHFDLGDVKSARSVAEALMAEFPDRWLGHDYLGHTHSRDGNHAKALECALAALALDPEHWGLLARVGVIHEELGQYDCAVAYLEDAQRRTEDRRPVEWLARVRSRMAAPAEA